MPNTLLLSLTAFLLFIACDDKHKTQAVSSESKDTVAAVATGSLLEDSKNISDTTASLKSLGEQFDSLYKLLHEYSLPISLLPKEGYPRSINVTHNTYIISDGGKFLKKEI